MESVNKGKESNKEIKRLFERITKYWISKSNNRSNRLKFGHGGFIKIRKNYKWAMLLKKWKVGKWYDQME